MKANKDVKDIKLKTSHVVLAVKTDDTIGKHKLNV